MSGAGTPDPHRTNLHATCVAFATRGAAAGVLITGPSGSGKSELGLQLIGLGARLVADDLTPLRLRDGRLVALAPPRLQGVIEARRLGLIRAPYQQAAPVRLVVDMGRSEAERLPHNHVTCLLGVAIETIYKVSSASFPVAVKLIATNGRSQ